MSKSVIVPVSGPSPSSKDDGTDTRPPATTTTSTTSPPTTSNKPRKTRHHEAIRASTSKIRKKGKEVSRRYLAHNKRDALIIDFFALIRSSFLTVSLAPRSNSPSSLTNTHHHQMDDSSMSFIEGRGVKELGVSNVQSSAFKAFSNLTQRFHKIEIFMHFSQILNSLKEIDIGWPETWKTLNLESAFTWIGMDWLLDFRVVFPYYEEYIEFLWIASPVVVTALVWHIAERMWLNFHEFKNDYHSTWPDILTNLQHRLVVATIFVFTLVILMSWILEINDPGMTLGIFLQFIVPVWFVFGCLFMRIVLGFNLYQQCLRNSKQEYQEVSEPTRKRSEERQATFATPRSATVIVASLHFVYLAFLVLLPVRRSSAANDIA